MVNRFRHQEPPKWCSGEYNNATLVRFFLLIALWILYGLIPHKLPLSTLHIFSIALVSYLIYLFWQKRILMGWLIILAVLLNELLALYLHPLFNLLLTLVITAILLFDIANAP